MSGTKSSRPPAAVVAQTRFAAKANETMAARNRIAAKHADLLLCDPPTVCPLVGIDLDVVSQARPDRQEREALVSKVFEAAGLPLVRFPAQPAYTLAQVTDGLSVVFGDGAHGERPPTGEPAVSSGQGEAGNVGQETPNASPPLCPKCGIVLVIRTGPRGNFYGCPNFPKCRTTAPI